MRTRPDKALRDLQYRQYISAILSRPAAENDEVADGEVQEAGKGHCEKIADEDIPGGKTFYQEQDNQTKEEDCRGREVIGNVQTKETATCPDAVLPDIEVGYGEVYSDGALKGEDRGNNVFTPIGAAQEVVRQNPEHKRIDHRTDSACAHKPDIPA